MKLNILYITVDFPYPLNSGGSVSAYFRIRQMAKRGHNIFLFSSTTFPVQKESIDELKKYCKDIRIYQIGKGELIFNLLLFPVMPIRNIRRFSRKMKKDIAEILNSNKIDIVFFCHYQTASKLFDEYLKNIKCVMFIGDINYKNLLKVAKQSSFFSLKKLLFYTEAYKTKLIEEKVFNLPLIDEFWFASEDDIKDILSKFPILKNKIRFMPTGMELKYPFEDKLEEIQDFSNNDKVILLVGSMNNLSSEDSARWFASEMFPRIKSKVPEAKLCIVGKNSKNKLSDISSEGVIIVGEVPDLKPYLKRCDLYVVPLRIGAGIRIKLLDGLSAKRVVITTPMGIEAINDIIPDFHLIVAKDENEFVNKSIEVLKNPEKYNKIAENGFNFFKEFFSEEAVGNLVEKNLINLVSINLKGA